MLSYCWLMQSESSTTSMGAQIIYTVLRLIKDEEASVYARFQVALNGYFRDQNPCRTKRRLERFRSLRIFLNSTVICLSREGIMFTPFLRYGVLQALRK